MKTCLLPNRNLRLAYEENGRGRPFVLLHAFPFDRTMWEPQQDELQNVAKVIVPDFPGFGESTAGNGAFSIESAADVLAEFLTAIGISEKIILGGLSMGGYIALAFTRRHPERLAGLILADTKSDPDDETGKANREKAIALVRDKGVPALIESNLPNMLSDDTRAQRLDVVEQVRQIAERQRPEVVIAALAALRDRPDALPGLSQIRVPTLVIVGEKDAVTPLAVAEKIAKGVSGSRLVTIPGAGHLSNLENPAAFNAAAREFLNLIPTA